MTRLSGLFRCSAPIQSAAMPGISTVELVAAIARSGGIGMLPAAMRSPAGLDCELAELREMAPGVFGVNFLVPFIDHECVTIAARKSELIEFFYGDPDSNLVARAHAHGARVSWQVGSLEEAVAAQRAGCDVVVVQGTEAGGHVRGQTSLFPVLSQVLEVLDTPVIAAGGIATARDVAAVLAAGAAGARIGTRLVAAAESGAHPSYVRALIDASASDTCLTEAYCVMWPNAPHRVLRSAIAARRPARSHRALLRPVSDGGHARPHRRDGALRRRVRFERSPSGTGRGHRARSGLRRFADTACRA